MRKSWAGKPAAPPDTAGDAWHNDVSCDPHPIWASFLRVTRLPEVGGGDTAFANLYLAYESLSEPIKQLLLGLTVHDGGKAGAMAMVPNPSRARYSMPANTRWWQSIRSAAAPSCL
jgi:alpha-ketoglutarate-dependent taurine dioxygenase